MKICLITPPSPFLIDERVFPALGVLRVGAVLEQAGHTVDHLDLCGVTNYEDVINDYHGASVFGVTATTLRFLLPCRSERSCARSGGRRRSSAVLMPPVYAAAKRGNERAKISLDYLLGTSMSWSLEMVEGDLHGPSLRGLVDADDPKRILWNTSKDFEESPWPARHLVDMDSYHYTIDGVKSTSAIAQLGCLSPDTPIVLSSMYEKPISEIVVGDEVLCFDTETRKVVPRRVEQTYQREADDLWEIEWGNGQRLRITGEHPIYTREGWKTIQEIEVGGVSAYLRGMQYEFSRQIGLPDREVLHENVQGRVAEDSSEYDVATRWAGDNESAICCDDSRRKAPILHGGEEQYPPTDATNQGEVVVYKTRPPESDEASGGGEKGFDLDPGEVRGNLFRANEEVVGRREARSPHNGHKKYIAKQNGDAICGDSVQRSSPIPLRRKWRFLDRALYIGETQESRLPLKEGEEGDFVPRRILASGGRDGSRAGLLEQGVDPAYGMVEGIEGRQSSHLNSEASILWSTITSKRFIGRGTVCNITICPTHNYFANGMLVHNCPFHCKFCGNRNSPMLRQIRVRSPENVVQEMVHLHDRYGISGIMHFQDELNVSHKGLVDLMRQMKETEIDWKQRGFVKAELFNEEQAESMYAAGFRWLMCGFESAHPRILKNIAKNATQDDNTRMLRIAHKAGIKVKALMSVGHPGESEETILATRDWLLEEKPDEFDVTIITVYPGTPYFDEAVCIGEPVYKFETNGDALYSENTDFHLDQAYYKGRPGDYHAFVWTDYISREKIATMRDEVEHEVRTKLGIPYASSAAAINFEHSMGQHLPSNILKTSAA